MSDFRVWAENFIKWKKGAIYLKTLDEMLYKGEKNSNSLKLTLKKRYWNSSSIHITSSNCTPPASKSSKNGEI